MVTENPKNLFQRMDQHEYQICLLFNRYAAIEMVRGFFAVISRLGNGVFWYVLMLLLPVFYGQTAIETSIIMAATGLIGVIIYKLLKNNLVRQRPCIHHDAIQQGTTMLDLYSFPSGHTPACIFFYDHCCQCISCTGCCISTTHFIDCCITCCFRLTLPERCDCRCVNCTLLATTMMGAFL